MIGPAKQQESERSEEDERKEELTEEVDLEDDVEIDLEEGIKEETEGKERYLVKPVLSGHSKRTPKIGFQYRISLNAGQKYCRMLSWSILQYF